MIDIKVVSCKYCGATLDINQSKDLNQDGTKKGLECPYCHNINILDISDPRPTHQTINVYNNYGAVNNYNAPQHIEISSKPEEPSSPCIAPVESTTKPSEGYRYYDYRDHQWYHDIGYAVALLVVLGMVARLEEVILGDVIFSLASNIIAAFTLPIIVGRLFSKLMYAIVPVFPLNEDDSIWNCLLCMIVGVLLCIICKPLIGRFALCALVGIIVCLIIDKLGGIREIFRNFIDYFDDTFGYGAGKKAVLFIIGMTLVIILWSRLFQIN